MSTAFTTPTAESPKCFLYIRNKVRMSTLKILGQHNSRNPSKKKTNEYPNRSGRKELSLFAQDMVHIEGPKTYTLELMNIHIKVKGYQTDIKVGYIFVHSQ